MASGLSRWLPATLFGRLAVLLGVAALVSHVLALSLIFQLMPLSDGNFAGGARAADRGVLEAPPGPYALADRAPAGGPDEFGLSDGPRERPPPPGPRPWMTPGLLIDISVRLLALTLAAWIAAKWISAPMKRLADAAQNLGNQVGVETGGRKAGWLLEEGPQECREAAVVFNRMCRQIQQQFRDRDRFVAAVSHDLRTPLTRLRLRVESLSRPDQVAQFRGDLAEMDRMIAVTLDYLTGSAAAEAIEALDVQALVHGLVADQVSQGHAAECRGQAKPLRCRPTAIKRCLSNLIENALRYGAGCRVRLLDNECNLRIEISDSGPGIPEHELKRVLEPFYRVDASRKLEHAGVGLGLSIAHEIARQHGGSLTLRNRAEGGLQAELVLPR